MGKREKVYVSKAITNHPFLDVVFLHPYKMVKLGMVDPIALLIKITSHILQPHCRLSNCHTAADNPNTHPAARPESGKGHSLAI